MSESVTSGEATVAPAETVSAPPEAVPTTAKENAATPVASFGTGRGSGLARGKRGTTPASATAQNAPAGGYTPTAIQVVTAERQYKNPFAPEQPAPPAEPITPIAPAAAELPVSAPVASVPAAPMQTPAETRVSVNETPATSPASAGAVSALPEEKAELKILPPEERPRPAQSWESNSFPAQSPAGEARPQSRREDRPTFRPERRDSRPNEVRPNSGSGENQGARREERSNDFRRPDRSGEPRREPREPRGDGRDGRDFRENRETRERREPRPLESRPAPAPVPDQKSGGFFAWLKGLFAGDATPVEKPAEPTKAGDDNPRFEGGGQRRHHRGGRGRSNNYRGPGPNRGEQSADPRSEAREEDRGPREGQAGNTGEFNSERRFEGGGQRRRRHRGGRGRGGFRGDNRGGNEPRSEGGGPPTP